MSTLKSKDLPAHLRRKMGLKDRKPPKPRSMNGWEREYAEMVLEPRLRAEKNGSGIFHYAYEAHRLILPGGVRYMPDFFVLVEYRGGFTTDGLEIEFHEIKGRKRDGGMARFKIARDLNPWARFRLITKRGGKFEEIDV
jgi:hypothetical protein